MLLRLKNRKQWWMEIYLKIWLEWYGISGSDSNSISCFFFLYEECCRRDKFRVTKGLSGTGNQQNNFRIFSMVLVFFVALLALTYIQYIVSLAINAVTGILVSIVILISSVYQIHPFLIGNYFMCMRQMMFAMDDVGFLTQGAVSVGIIFFMAVIGYQILKRKDLF